MTSSISAAAPGSGSPSDPWALEMQVEDPDGNVLRSGSDPEALARPPALVANEARPHA